jgi:hypothetical protein
MHIRRWSVLAVLGVAVLAAGCGGPHKAAKKNTHPLRVLRNDLRGGNLTTKHKLAGDSVVIKSVYSTDYDTTAWKITDSKTLHFEISPVNLSTGTQVLLEHVHADVGLSATLQALNGMPQDGIEITPVHPYRNDFSIEGYSQTLTSGWGFMVGGYGALDVSEDRLTESNLRDKGVNGNKIVFVYVLLVKDKGDELWHENEFKDEFIVKVR